MTLPFEEYLIKAVFEIVNQSSFLRLIVIFLGSILPWIIIIWFITAVLYIKSFKLKFYYFAVAIISVIISRGFIVETIHNIFYFPRPFEVFGITPIISSAFTSGLLSEHIALLTPIVLAFLLMHKKSGIVATSLVILVGIAGVAAGVYWVSALLFGLFIGALSFLFVKKILPSISSITPDITSKVIEKH